MTPPTSEKALEQVLSDQVALGLEETQGSRQTHTDKAAESAETAAAGRNTSPSDAACTAVRQNSGAETIPVLGHGIREDCSAAGRCTAEDGEGLLCQADAGASRHSVCRQVWLLCRHVHACVDVFLTC